MTAIGEPCFQSKRCADDLYCISESHYSRIHRANLWPIRGRDADLLIDTGLAALRGAAFSAADTAGEVRPGHHRGFGRRDLHALVGRFLDAKTAVRCPGDG